MKKILYLEDSRMSQQLLNRFLEGIGQVTAVGTLEEGRAALQREHFDLIVADYLFPEGTIMEFLEEVRLQHAPFELPIIVTSGSLDRHLIGQILRTGANDCLPKPFRKQQVQDKVARMLAAPYINTEEVVSMVVVTVQWHQQGVYYQYAPELDRRVEGHSAEEVWQKMRTLLEQEKAAGKNIGLLTHFECSSHFLDEEKSLPPLTDS